MKVHESFSNEDVEKSGTHGGDYRQSLAYLKSNVDYAGQVAHAMDGNNKFVIQKKSKGRRVI
jgi:hypothetical protein